MARVLVRDLDPRAVAKLKARAKRGGRSLQAELKRILEEAARESDAEEFWKLATRFRRKLAGRRFTDSAELLREDRDR